MNTNNLYILIATLDNRALNLLDMLIDEQEQVFYVITHQITTTLGDKTKDVVKLLKNRKDINYLPLYEVIGLSNNRNNSLKYIEDGIALISDDDIIFCEKVFKKIKDAFILNPKADLITFKALNLSEKDYRQYPDKIVSHNHKSITGIGSIEIAFRVKSIKKNHINFDKNFGIGSIYPVGEDYIFMADVLKKGLNAIFVPVAIVKHPEISTGLRFDKEIIYGRGAVFARVFGVNSLFVDIFYSFKKYGFYKNNFGFISYLILMLKGSIDYLKTKKDKNSD